MASESALLIKFYWRGKDKTGRPVKGEIMASSPSMAKAELYKKGIYTSQISAEKWRSFFALFHKKIHTRDITLFIRQLFTLLTAGIPIVESLNIIIESQSHPKHKKLFISIQNDIKAGTTLSNALKKFPRFFTSCSAHGPSSIPHNLVSKSFI